MRLPWTGSCSRTGADKISSVVIHSFNSVILRNIIATSVFPCVRKDVLTANQQTHAELMEIIIFFANSYPEGIIKTDIRLKFQSLMKLKHLFRLHEITLDWLL